MIWKKKLQNLETKTLSSLYNFCREINDPFLLTNNTCITIEDLSAEFLPRQGTGEEYFNFLQREKFVKFLLADGAVSRHDRPGNGKITFWFEAHTWKAFMSDLKQEYRRRGRNSDLGKVLHRVVTYPLPRGCKFEHVKIELASDSSLRIRLPERNPRVLTYSDLGFQDKRRGDMPNVLWEVLRALAENNGTIDWESEVPPAWRKQLPKHVQRLRQQLQSIFQTNQDPFEYDFSSKGYRCRFQVKDASRGGAGRRSTKSFS